MTPAVPTDTTPRATRRRFAARALLGFCLLSSAPWLLPGCGGNAFSGGGVPIGKSAVFGKVLSAESPRTPLPGATVTVIATTDDNESFTYREVADAEGDFVLPDLPTGPSSSSIQVRVEPNDTTVRGQSLVFRLYRGRAANLLVALPRLTTDTSAATQIAFSPPSIAILPDSTQAFRVEVRDSEGNALPVTPTLLFNDDFGTLNADGTITTTGVGTGAITAFWYDGLRNTAPVYSTPNGPVTPPPPPQSVPDRAGPLEGSPVPKP